VWGGRLQWLNSRLGLEGSSLPPPFTRVSVAAGGAGAGTAQLLGKSVTVGTDGMLSSVLVSSDPAHPGVTTQALASPVRFEVSLDGKPIELAVTNPAKLLLGKDRRSVSWSSALSSRSPSASALVGVEASLDFSGYADFVVTLNVSKAKQLAVDLVLPLEPR
jgi:hypothetical protein